MDVTPELLPFAVLFKDAILGDSTCEIEELFFLPAGAVCLQAPDEHCESIDEFISKFGGVRFKPRP